MEKSFCAFFVRLLPWPLRMSQTRDGVVQLCSRLQAGMEGVIHAVCELFDLHSDDCWELYLSIHECLYMDTFLSLPKLFWLFDLQIWRRPVVCSMTLVFV